MDTVSMLNKMSFYCQPILPLVYDESMSYYETLCKVVGQLNTTGDAVNKLNVGLTGEIADRHAADAELDDRIKVLEQNNKKIHFIKVDTLGNLLTADVTREKLYQWSQGGDLIVMLYAPDELENSWAVATNYRCMSATGADTMQLSFYVPISITNNAGKSGLDVTQEVVAISLPVGALTNQWQVRHITTTIPETNADGFVNLTATVSNAWAVTCDVEPGAVVDALRNHFSSTNQFAVAVNARLSYDGKQYHSASAIVKADASGTGNVRITFENYYNGVRAENGVRQMNIETIFLVGDAQTNVWSVETIDNKAFDFSRYDGFQFTRGENNVITANDESTPNAVYAQYHSDTSGKLYQNLPVRLIDTVNNAEYWNGVFDIKDNKHMTFTFVTSNYTTASDKMAVRVIELSADANTTTWKYAEKEFELPITGSFTVDDAMSDTSTNPVQNKVVKAALDEKLSTQGGEVTGSLSITRGITVGRTNDDTGIHLYKDRVGVAKMTSGSADVDDHIAMARLKVASPTEDDDAATKKYVDDHGAANAVRYTAQSLTFEQKQQARKNIQAADSVWPTITGGVSLCPENITDSNDAAHVKTTRTSADAYTVTVDGGPENQPVLVKGIRTPTDADTDAAANVEYVNAKVSSGGSADAVLYTAQTLTDAQKKQARENIDAAVADFVINGTLNDSDSAVTLDKTFVQIQAAIQEGKHPVVKLSASGMDPTFIPMVSAGTTEVIFAAVPYADNVSIMIAIVRITSAGDVKLSMPAAPAISYDGTLSQFPMSSDPTEAMEIATKKYVDEHAGGGSSVTVDTAMSDTSTNAVQNKVIKKYVDDHSSSSDTKVTLVGNIEGEVEGYTSTTFQQIKDEIAKNRNIWLTINGETVRLASYKTNYNQAVFSSYKLVFFGAGDGALTVKYEVTASASSASLTVTGS